MKPNAARILRKLQDLRGSAWLGKRRSDWPDHLYHYSDVRNVASILKSGKLMSRNRVGERGLHEVDIADAEIIEQTKRVHGYARLYFRPRTPMQYHIEGIRPLSPSESRHCPVPVFLRFDAKKLLTSDACLFTNGNAATFSHEMGDDADFFDDLDFKKIYHTGSFSQAEKGQIIFARHAEVLFPDELGLEDLVDVICRTGAERRTLLTLLGKEALNWAQRVRLEQPHEGHFDRMHAYVEDMSLVGNAVHITLHSGQGDHWQEIEITADGTTYKGRVDPKPLPKTQRFTIPVTPDRARVKYRISGHLAFSGMVAASKVFA